MKISNTNSLQMDYTNLNVRTKGSQAHTRKYTVRKYLMQFPFSLIQDRSQKKLLQHQYQSRSQLKFVPLSLRTDWMHSKTRFHPTTIRLMHLPLHHVCFLSGRILSNGKLC